MKKNGKKIFKIVLALGLVFSQLSNAVVVFADQLDSTDEVVENVVTSESLETDENLTDEEGNVFTVEDLEAMIDYYLKNSTTLDDRIINLLKEYESPHFKEGESNEVGLEDIMFVNELLKGMGEEIEEEPEEVSNEEVDPEIPENEVGIKLGEIPDTVSAGKIFDVEILISNDNDAVLIGDTEEMLTILNATQDESEEKENYEDFIDGIEGNVVISDNLRLREVKFTNFVGNKNKDANKFVGAGEENYEDGAKLLTLTFEALQEGEGSVTINGTLAEYLNFTNFENLSFSINITAREGSGLATLTSSVGNFDKEFDGETYEYVLTVPSGTTEVTLSGSLVNEYDTAVGLSSYVIEEDETLVTVNVTGFDGMEVNYFVRIIRETEEVNVVEVVEEEKVVPAIQPVVYVYSSNNYLKSLSIKDYEINFEKGVLEYKIKVPANIRTLDITAVAEDYRSRVEINGNGEFKDGENVVTIKVTAENGETREYKLLVEKEKEISNLKELDESNGRAEKIVIITLIVLVVVGLLYLIFVKDETATGARLVSDAINTSKKNKNSKER